MATFEQWAVIFVLAQRLMSLGATSVPLREADERDTRHGISHHLRSNNNRSRGGGGGGGGDVTDNPHAFTVQQKLSELVYKNQIRERSMLMKSSKALAVFAAEWPCYWGEEVTGDYATWDPMTNYTDGWKFTCGIRKISSPCIVYSMGSCGNMAFEKGVLQSNPSCEIFIFDKDNFGIEKWFPDPADRAKVRFQRAFIGTVDDPNANPPLMKPDTIMAKLGHKHVDILKMDIEGSEWAILKGPLPSIGQLLVEMHLGYGEAKPKDQPESAQLQHMASVVDNLETHGLRLFHKEINLWEPMRVAEFSFIQKSWTPLKKEYLILSG